ncbi:MAG: hypothetical protein GY906_24540 [bacterium]|nr:hypothetical protein [bacterium]
MAKSLKHCTHIHTTKEAEEACNQEAEDAILRSEHFNQWLEIDQEDDFQEGEFDSFAYYMGDAYRIDTDDLKASEEALCHFLIHEPTTYSEPLGIRSAHIPVMALRHDGIGSALARGISSWINRENGE